MKSTGMIRKIWALLWRDMHVLQVPSVVTGRLGKGAELTFLGFYRIWALNGLSCIISP